MPLLTHTKCINDKIDHEHDVPQMTLYMYIVQISTGKTTLGQTIILCT